MREPAETEWVATRVLPRTERALSWLAVTLWLLALVLALAATLIGFRYPDSFEDVLAPAVTTWMYATVGLVGLGYATAGLLILRHRPRHAIGWLLLLTGPALVAVFVSAGIGLTLHEQGDALGAWFALVSAVGWWPAVLMAGPGLAILFPDGRLPGQRWRLPFVASLAALFAALAVLAIQPDGFAGADGPPNPLAVPGLPAWVFELAALVANIVIFGQLLLAVAAVVVRFRRGRGDERQQMKWFASAVIAWGVVFAASWFADWEGSAVVVLAAFLLVPGAVVVAITRYRLYEIDRLINRTLVYVPLVGIVAGLYAAMVLFFGRLLTALTGDTSDVAAIISALILAAVFTPIRKGIEGTVDRTFKPVPATGASDAQAPTPLWDEPGFTAAVERIARRVMSEHLSAPSEGRGDGSAPAVIQTYGVEADLIDLEIPGSVAPATSAAENRKRTGARSSASSPPRGRSGGDPQVREG